MFVSLPDTPMSPNYQHADMNHVFRSLLAGQSCSLIGIGSVGKSNLLHNLTREDVQAHYVGDDAPYLLAIYLDPHTLIHLDGDALRSAGRCWAGYELLLSRLHRTLAYLEGTSSKKSKKHPALSLAEAVSGYLNRVRSSDSVIRQSGLRHLEEAVLTVLRDDDRWRVAFLLDEIGAFGHLPPAFFVSLRGLRDQFKGRVMYVTTSGTPVAEALPPEREMREFAELFGDHTRYISPLDADSATEVIDRFIRRYEHSYTIRDAGREFLRNEVFALAGGHVGLLRRSFRPAVGYLIDGEPGSLQDYLLHNESVRHECERILASLTEDERRVFYHAITDGSILDMAVWHQLVEKHIVKLDGGQADFQMPLLGAYALQHPERLVSKADLK